MVRQSAASPAAVLVVVDLVIALVGAIVFLFWYISPTARIRRARVGEIPQWTSDLYLAWQWAHLCAMAAYQQLDIVLVEYVYQVAGRGTKAFVRLRYPSVGPEHGSCLQPARSLEYQGHDDSWFWWRRAVPGWTWLAVRGSWGHGWHNDVPCYYVGEGDPVVQAVSWAEAPLGAEDAWLRCAQRNWQPPTAGI
ncbi:MAG: hypothetical protein LBJ62_10400 [Bifidobacteriaceae bacterium]|jgi:hypothetical protein|nr:hypothetical protein [Bifidobacteriaceae bacterium]